MQTTPGTVRSILRPEIERLIGTLGVHWVEPQYTNVVGLGSYWPYHDILTVREKSHIDHNHVFLHELTHWTGHPNRLNRKLYAHVLSSGHGGRVAIKDMHQEEATAEYGAYMLSVAFGLDATRAMDYLNSYLTTCYLADWNKAEEDAKAAVGYILSEMNDAKAA